MLKAVKHIVITLSLLVALAEGVSAQHYVGLRGGFGGGNGNRFYPKVEMATAWGLYHGGVSWKYFSPQKYVGGVQADVLFMQQAYKQMDYTVSVGRFPGDSTGYRRRDVNSIMVPMFWQPHVYLFKRNMRVYLNLGVTLSYNINQRQITGSDLNGVFTDEKYEMTLIRDNRWSYGLAGGGGLGYSFGRVEVLGEVRYYIGYGDLMVRRNVYPDNQFLRSPLDGLQVSFGVYYRIGKKGILSPPSPRVEQKLREAEERKMQKRTARLPEGERIEGLELPEGIEEIITGEGEPLPETIPDPIPPENGEEDTPVERPTGEPARELPGAEGEPL